MNLIKASAESYSGKFVCFSAETDGLDGRREPTEGSVQHAAQVLLRRASSTS